MMTGGVPVVPTRASLSATNRAANPATIRSEQGTRFFGTSQTQAAPRTTFNEQASRIQEALRGNGAPSAQQQGAQRETEATGNGARPGVGSSGASIRPPTRNETQQGNGTATVPNRGGQAGAPEGWSRFGNANGTNTPESNAPSYRPRVYQPPANLGNQSTRPEQNAQPGANSGGWQHFTPRPAQSPNGRGNEGYSQPGYQGSPSSGRGQAPSYRPPQYSSRPPLNMSRPIISGPPRSAPSRSSSGRIGGAPRSGGGGRSSGRSGRR